MKLLEPLVIGPRTAPNRVLFGPHETNLGWDRSFSERHTAYYARRAQGGAGIIVTEEASVHPSCWPYERAPLATECGPGWKAVAEACSAHGTLVLAGIGHSGGQGSSAFHQRELWAPSGVPEVNSREMPKVIEPSDIAAVVAGFGEAARLATASGLAGVEVNAGQHSLIRQFLSGLTNMRGDDYGADKVRFAREVLAAVRAGAGPDAVVGLRLSCDELAPWAGVTPEMAEGIAAELAPLCDYLVVVRGGIFSVAQTRPDGHDQPGFNLGLCRQIRSALAGAVGGAVPVFAQGSIVDAGQAEWALDDGVADGVEMTRAQLADPDLVAKLRDGRAPRPCILCNQRCKVRDNRNPLVSCVVEPRTGYEWSDPDAEARRAAHPMDVTVVGAGPAGLEAARVAATHGHRVTLVERSERLGGQVPSAAALSGRDQLSALVDWLAAECDRLGVTVRTGQPVAPGAATGAVIVASGGVDRPVEYEIASGAVVLAAAAVAAGERSTGPLAIWDPIGGPIGVALAETLAAEGRAVHLLSPDFVVGTQLSLTGDLAPANTRLHQAGVALHKRVLLRRVEPGALTVEDRYAGTTSEIAADWLVDAGHRLADPTSWPETAVRVGDAVAPRTIAEAILEGRRAALGLG